MTNTVNMTDEQLDEVLLDLPFVEAWCAAVRKEAIHRLEDGAELEHARLSTRRTRAWASEESALAWLRKSFPLKTIAPRKMLSVAQAEKVVKGEIPADYIEVKASRPSLQLKPARTERN